MAPSASHGRSVWSIAVVLFRIPDATDAAACTTGLLQPSVGEPRPSRSKCPAPPVPTATWRRSPRRPPGNDEHRRQSDFDVAIQCGTCFSSLPWVGMSMASIRVGALFATGNSWSRIEFILLGAAAVLLIVLLAVKVRRSQSQKKWKAASTGFHDFDVERYGHSAVGKSLIDTSVNPGARPLAPSFVSPKHGATHKADTPHPLVVPSSFGAIDRSRPATVRSFDAEEALRLRPPSDVTPERPPPSPGGPSTEETTATGSALPLLVQPPAPPPRASEAPDR